MLIKVHSVAIDGLKPIPVDIEVQSTTGIPQIIIIGLVNAAIREAKDRIVSALKHLGIRLKAKRTIISLTPADIKKSGSSFDLAIAVGLISLYRPLYISLKNAVFIGEISLDGSIQPISGCLARVLAAQHLGYTTVYIPHDNLQDVSLVENIKIWGLKRLDDLLVPIAENRLSTPANHKPKIFVDTRTIPEVIGQYETVRALTIAIAGRHHLHLVGPPGVGKTWLPRVAHYLSPLLDKKQSIALLERYSLFKSQQHSDIIAIPPFRTPHHSSTLLQLFGNISKNNPGEIAFAHHGILLLDELPEFSPTVLKALRTELDRQSSYYVEDDLSPLPTRCVIIATSNPCPCGYWQTGIRKCKCTAGERARYTKKLSGPLLDRIDLHSTVLPLGTSDYSLSNKSLDLEEYKKSVRETRLIQEARYLKLNFYNAHLKMSDIKRYCSLDASASILLHKASEALHLSTRSFQKTIAVAQTIADLEKSSIITEIHIAEALSYRFEPVWTVE